MKVKVIPVITGAARVISKSLRQYPSSIPGKHKIKEIKNSRIWYCTHTTESTNLKIKTYFMCINNIIYSTNCKYRTAATL
jgi:hypothetical protein